METKEDKSVITQPSLPNFIAGNLRLLRKRQGWSQSELARRVSLNRGNIASYESGTAEPSICKLLRISNLFEVNPRDFTRKDFTRPGELDLARHSRSELLDRERQEVSEIRDRALELTELVTSSRKLFDYQLRNLSKPCPEVDILSSQYLQLYDVAQRLLQDHRDLLTKVGCQCGE